MHKNKPPMMAVIYLNNLLNNFPVAFPAALLTMSFPKVPFLTAFISPSILAEMYKKLLNPLILISLLFKLYKNFFWIKD